MRTGTFGVVVMVCMALAGCGGKSEADRAGTVATQLASRVKATDPLGACRTLTLATRRAIALTGIPGSTCKSALLSFLTSEGLRESLPAAEDFDTKVSGSRATFTAKGLDAPLAGVRNAGGWRVSLIGLPGVRGDVKAARACGAYLDGADARPVLPAEPPALTARLRADARLVDALRRRLARVPLDGPRRAGLPALLRTLRTERNRLRASARAATKSGNRYDVISRGGGAAARVRYAVEHAGLARVACPRDVAEGPEAGTRRVLIDRACSRFERDLAPLHDNPATRAEFLANSALIDHALGPVARRIRAAPVGRRLRGIRRQTLTALAAVQTDLRAFPGVQSVPAAEAIVLRLEGHAGQLDDGVRRLGAGCITTPTPSGAPTKKS